MRGRASLPGHMRILIVYPGPTHPLRDGYQLALSAYVTQLQELGYSVDLLCVYDPRVTSLADLQPTREHWGEHYYEYATQWLERFRMSLEYRVFCPARGGHTLDGLCPSGLPEYVRRLVERKPYQAILINHWYLSGVFRHVSGIRKIIYAFDVFAGRRDRVGARWLSTDSRTEGCALDRADVVLAIQESEGRILSKCTRTSVITALCHYPTRAVPLGPADRLLFLGSSNKANVDAMRSFIQRVMPLVRHKVPHARLIIGGNVCRGLEDFKVEPGVTLQFEVDSLDAFYGQAALVVNPVSTGTGLKIKTFEALAYGRVVLCDPHSIDGVWAAHASPAIECRNPMEYAEAIEVLIGDPAAVSDYSRRSLAYIRHVNHHFENTLAAAIAFNSPTV